MRILSYVFYIGLYFNSFTSVEAKTVSLFNAGEHCVAYRAKNRMALLVVVSVVGRNCQVSAQVLPALDDKYYLEVRVPVAGFDSKESERDTDVMKLLKGEAFPHLIFRSESLTKKQWSKKIADKVFVVEGNLKVANKWHPISASMTYTEIKKGEAEVDGIIHTNFKAFDLEAPKLAAGFGAKVKEDFELHFHILSKKTLGIGALLNHTEGIQFQFNSN